MRRTSGKSTRHQPNINFSENTECLGLRYPCGDSPSTSTRPELCRAGRRETDNHPGAYCTSTRCTFCTFRTNQNTRVCIQIKIAHQVMQRAFEGSCVRGSAQYARANDEDSSVHMSNLCCWMCIPQDSYPVVDLPSCMHPGWSRITCRQSTD